MPACGPACGEQPVEPVRGSLNAYGWQLARRLSVPAPLELAPAPLELAPAPLELAPASLELVPAPLELARAELAGVHRAEAGRSCVGQ